MDIDDFEVDEFLQAEPVDSWGVSYDLFTRRIEDDLPDGWHLYRATIYKRVVRRLVEAGYQQHLYSGYIRDNITAADAWLTMLDLLTVRPLGVMQTVARNLWIYRAPHRLLYNAAHLIEPGARFFESLPGPAPAAFSPPQMWGLFVVPPAPLQDAALIPREVRESVASRNPQNWHH